MVKDGPSGDLFLQLVKDYPGHDLLNLNATRSHVLVASPRLLADLLVHKCYDFTKPTRIAGFLRHILGDGLIIVEGDQHKFLRKNTMPAFSFRNVKQLYPMMWRKAEILTKTLKKEISHDSNSGGYRKGDTAIVELSAWASKVTLDIIGVAGLGRDFNVVEKGEDKLQHLYEELLEPSNEKLLFSMLSLALGLPVVRMLPWKMNGVFKYLVTSLNDVCSSLVHDKRRAIAMKQDTHFDVLSLLIKTDNFTDSALKDQLLTFLAAG